MVRALTLAMQTARDEDNHIFAHLAKIFWPSGLEVYSDRGTTEINPDPGLTILPHIAQFSIHARTVSFDIDGGGGSSVRANLILSTDASDADNVALRVRNEEVIGTLIETYVVMAPASGTLDENDWILLGRWTIDESPSINNQTQTVRLSLVDTLQLAGEQVIGRIVTQGLLPAAPEKSSGKVLPQVFGVVNVEGVLITGGDRATLNGDIGPWTGVIPVNEDITGWPGSGLFFIGDEAIQYTDVDTGSKTLGTASTPVIRGWVTIPERHSDGNVVLRRRPTSDKYRFVFGDKQTGATVDTLEVNDEPQDSSLWADSDQTVAGETGLIVDLDKFPVKFTDTTRVRTLVLHEIREVRDISDATNADPIVITCPNGHNFAGGNAIFIDGVEGNTSTNGKRKVKASSPSPTATTFAITDMDDVTVAGVAAYTQGGSVHPQVLELTDFAGVWQSDNNVADWENTIDLSSEKLTSFVDMTPGDILALTPSVDLLSIFQNNANHPYLGRLIGTRVFVEYQARIGATTGVWPVTNTPLLEAVWRGLTSAGHILDEPEDLEEDADLFLSGDPSSNSTNMFDLAGSASGAGNLETERTYTLVFKELDNSIATATHPTSPSGTINFSYWPGFTGLADGDPIYSIFDSPQVGSDDSVDITGDVSENPNDGTIVHGLLVFRPFNDGSLPLNLHVTKLIARAWVRGESGSGSIDSLPRITIAAGGDTSDGSITVANDDWALVTATLVKASGYTKTEVLNAEVRLHADDINLTGLGAPASDEVFKWRYEIFKVELGSWDKPEFEGETTQITGHTTKLTQFTHDITEQVLSLGGWDSFLSSGTGQLRLSLTYPAQTNDMVLRVYRIGFEVDVIDQRVEITTEDNARVTGTVTGYGGVSNTAQETIEEIITGPSFLSKTTKDYNPTGLALALSDLVVSPWVMNRAITEQIRLDDLLASAVRDSGIHMAHDSGRLVFFPTIGSIDVDADSVRTINRSLRIGDAPNISKTHPDLVTNDLTVFYSRNVDGEFVQSTQKTNPFSLSLPWGRRREEIDSNWLTASAQVSELIDRKLSDFAFAHQLVPIIADGGKTIDLEVGDVVELDDDLNLLDSPAAAALGGTLVGATLLPGSDQHLLTVAVSDRVTTVEGSGDNRIDSGSNPSRLEFFIGGSLVGVLMYSGFYIRGEFQEDTTSPIVETHDNPVEFTSGEWRFGVKPSGDDTTYMRLDANGNVFLEGEFIEDLQYPIHEVLIGESTFFSLAGLVLFFYPGDRTLRMARLATSSLTARQFIEGAFRS